MKLSQESEIMDFNDRFHKLVNMAREQNNFNAYGWLMRYIQIEEDRKCLESRFTEFIGHLKRIEEELETKQWEKKC